MIELQTLPALLRVERSSEVLRRAPAGVSDWLSPSERGRYAGLRVASRANQFLAGHWLVREGLAARYGGTPRDWPLRERRSLPPLPEREGCTAQVSISHSGDWIAAAVADQPVGVDLEQRRPRAGLIAFAHLLRAEDDPPELDEDVLLQRWVIKEAWIKRHGFSALPERLASLAIRACAPDQADVRLWSDSEVHLGLCMQPGLSTVAFASPRGVVAIDCLPESAAPQYWQVRDLAAGNA